jgi:hypothetical protein
MIRRVLVMPDLASIRVVFKKGVPIVVNLVHRFLTPFLFIFSGDL